MQHSKTITKCEYQKIKQLRIYNVYVYVYICVCVYNTELRQYNSSY